MAAGAVFLPLTFGMASSADAEVKYFSSDALLKQTPGQTLSQGLLKTTQDSHAQGKKLFIIHKGKPMSERAEAMLDGMLWHIANRKNMSVVVVNGGGDHEGLDLYYGGEKTGTGVGGVEQNILGRRVKDYFGIDTISIFNSKDDDLAYNEHNTPNPNSGVQ